MKSVFTSVPASLAQKPSRRGEQRHRTFALIGIAQNHLECIHERLKERLINKSTLYRLFESLTSKSRYAVKVLPEVPWPCLGRVAERAGCVQ